MNLPWQRVLKAYRPLYLRGLLMDGPQRWPSTDKPGDLLKPVSSNCPRGRLVALTAAQAIFSFLRNKP